MKNNIEVSQKTFIAIAVIGTIVIVGVFAAALIYAHLHGGLSNIGA